MAEKGASVITTGRDEARGWRTVEEIRAGGHNAQFIAADFSEMSEVGRVAQVGGVFGTTILVAILGNAATTDDPTQFCHLWWVAAAACTAAAVTSLGLTPVVRPRRRRRLSLAT